DVRVAEADQVCEVGMSARKLCNLSPVRHVEAGDAAGRQQVAQPHREPLPVDLLAVADGTGVVVRGHVYRGGIRFCALHYHSPMHVEHSQKAKDLQSRVQAFMDAHVYPNEITFHRQIAHGDRWQPTAIVEELKPKARADGLWNLFLPESEYG